MGIQSIMQGAIRQGAKVFKKAPTVTRNEHGISVTTHLMTGTKVAHGVDGENAKCIILGSGNKLSKVLGEETTIVSYPKGSFFGGDTGLIAVEGKGGKGPLVMEPKGFGDLVKLMKEMAKPENQIAMG